jgi:glycosyltransferase involved in cell wall biosynthesis
MNYLTENMTSVAVIIPALNEGDSVARVIAAIPPDCAGEIVVVDNNSTDSTEEKARAAGALVLHEKQRGYGYACLKGIEYLKSQPRPPDIVVFLDADYSDYPEEMPRLLKPILEQGCGLVIGSRLLGERTRRALFPWQAAGIRLVTLFIRLLYGCSFSDIGPFRAVKFDRLLALNMREKTYGWTVEMQLKAVKLGLRIVEVPVKYRARIGKSKISGTPKGVLLAGYRMIAVVLKLRYASG